MASSNSSQIQNSGSDRDMMDTRKRKRMESNRESARRSRMRKQRHLDDLTAQIAQMGRENQQIIHTIDLTTQHFLSVEAENSVLRAQMSELSQRLDSLNGIRMANYMSTLAGPARFEAGSLGFLGNAMGDLGSFNEPWNIGSCYFNQPIMASADVLQY